jgi:DUF4097 and DUF4098 domain-containing protein YvlB
LKREYSLSGTGFGLFLIALGVAAFSDIAAKTHLLGAVWRCYPVLPILLGLDLILPKVIPVSNSITLVRPAGWIFTLTILITILGFISGVVPGLFQQEFKQLGFESFSPRLPLESNRNYRRTLQEDFELPPGITTIRIENEFGDLRVDSGVSNVVSATARIKYAFHPPKSEADSQQVKWTGQAQGNTFVVHLEHPKFENSFLPQFMALMVVKVPPGLAVELKNSFGQLRVSEIEGNLTVDNSNGQIRIGKVTGDTSIINRLSKLTIGSIGGNLTVESTAGQVIIAQVAKNLTIHHDFGDLKINDVGGDLTVTGKNSSLTMTRIQGKIQLENSFGSVHIKEALNAVTAEVSNGSLRVEMNQILNPVSLSAAFGSIELEVPKNAAFSLRANTAFGSIDTNLPVTRTQDTGGQSVTGDIHGGGPSVKLDARNGSIKIKD